MVPLIELRGAVVYSQYLGMPILSSYIVCVIGNMLPVPLIYLFARKVLEWGSHVKLIGPVFSWLLEKGRKAGDKLTYKVTYENTTGETAKTVTITDKVPAHTTYVDNSATKGGKYSNGTLTWTFSNVANGEKIEVTFIVTVDDDKDTEISNQAKVNDGTNEYNTNEVVNSKPVKDVVDADAPETSIDGKVVEPGQKLTYSITYKNIIFTVFVSVTPDCCLIQICFFYCTSEQECCLVCRSRGCWFCNCNYRIFKVYEYRLVNRVRNTSCNIISSDYKLMITIGKFVVLCCII